MQEHNNGGRSSTNTMTLSQHCVGPSAAATPCVVCFHSRVQMMEGAERCSAQVTFLMNNTVSPPRFTSIEHFCRSFGCDVDLHCWDDRICDAPKARHSVPS